MHFVQRRALPDAFELRKGSWLRQRWEEEREDGMVQTAVIQTSAERSLALLEQPILDVDLHDGSAMRPRRLSGREEYGRSVRSCNPEEEHGER